MDSVSKKTPDSMSKNPMDITALVNWMAETSTVSAVYNRCPEYQQGKRIC